MQIVNKNLFLVFFLLLSIVSFSQDILVSGSLYNKYTKEPISYATVRVINSGIYRDADLYGRFVITAMINDSLEITCIGYNPLRISINSVTQLDSVFLQQKVVTDPEIKISKPSVEIYGFVNDKKDRTFTGGSEGGRPEAATLIEIPPDVMYYRISKVMIRGKDFREENPVRLHIYSIDSNGLPGEELLKKSIVIRKEEGEKVVTIDLKDQNITIEGGGFFIGVQWLTSEKVKMFTGPELYETFRQKKILTYRKINGMNGNKWYAWFRNSVVFFPGGVLPSNDVPINMLASAEIDVFERQNK
jgi:hypothetical protein